MRIAIHTGTAAVVIRAQNRVVIAADSKTTRTDDPKWSAEISKIQMINDTVFVSAGFRKEEQLGYDLTETAIAAIKQGGSIAEQIARFESAFVPQLTKALNELRLLEPEFFHKHFVIRAALAAQVAFVGRDGDIAVRAFKAEESGTEVNVIAQEIPCPPRTAVFLGEDEAMYSLARSLGSRIVDDPLDSARSLVEAAIDSVPSRVGPPVRIVEVQNGNMRWA
jgi:hypothetical protein